MPSRYDEIMKTKPYLPLNMGGCLTEAMIAKARDELGETEEVKARTIPELRKLVQAEPDFNCPTDDTYLLQYLRARKFNVQRAFSLLKNFYEIKKSNDDMYGSFDEEALKRTYAMKSGFFLPYRDKDGCAIGVIRMRTWDVDAVNGAEAVTALTVAALWCVREPATQICGMRVLFDARGTTLRHIRNLIPRQAYLLARAFTNALPIRFKGIHACNESPIFRQLFSVMKLFLSDKMRKRLYLHGDNQKHLHKIIPKAILPVENFGGDNPRDVPVWFNSEIEKYFDVYHELTLTATTVISDFRSLFSTSAGSKARRRKRTGIILFDLTQITASAWNMFVVVFGFQVVVDIGIKHLNGFI